MRSLHSRAAFKAFTLAEVLITLAIIGVVAALTIPTVVRNYQKQVLKTQIRKQYSVFNRAINEINLLEFGGNLKCYYIEDSGGDSVLNDCKAFYEILAKKLKVTKICNKYSLRDGCQPKYHNYTTATTCGGFNQDSMQNNSRTYVLADGTLLIPYYGNPTPLFAVDINGKAGPNKRGYDLFSVIMRKYDNNKYIADLRAGCIGVDDGGIDKYKEIESW